MKRVRKIAPEAVKPTFKRTPAMLRLLQLEKDQAARMAEAKDDENLLESSSSSEDIDGRTRKRARLSQPFRRLGQKRERRFLDAFLLEEAERGEESFLTTTAPKSRYPAPKLCRICLADAPYTCVACSFRHCSLRCRDVHRETSCSQPLR